MEGKKDQAKGRVKEAAGSLADDDELRREGKLDKAAGDAKEKVRDLKDKAGDVVDSVKEKAKDLTD